MSTRDTYTLEELAEELRKLSDRQRLDIFEMGRLLVAVKRLVRGQFEKWVEVNCNFSVRSARSYMSVYRRCAGRREVVNRFSPSVLYEVCAPSFPPEVRETLMDDALKGVNKDIRLKELLIFVSRYNKGEVRIDDPEFQSLLRRGRQGDSLAYCSERVEELLNGLERWLAELRNSGSRYSVKSDWVEAPLIEKYPADLADLEHLPQEDPRHEFENLLNFCVGEAKALLAAWKERERIGKYCRSETVAAQAP